jgi:hypothetical protein
LWNVGSIATTVERQVVMGAPGDVMPGAPAPADGDLVVDVHARHHRRHEALVYVRSTSSVRHWHRFPTREDAIAFALEFSSCRHLRAWLTDNAVDFEVLEDFRVMESADSPR